MQTESEPIRDKLNLLRTEVMSGITAKTRSCDLLELETRLHFKQSFDGTYPDEDRSIFALRFDESDGRLYASHENGSGFDESEQDFESSILVDLSTDQLVQLYDLCCEALPAEPLNPHI